MSDLLWFLAGLCFGSGIALALYVLGLWIVFNSGR